MWVQTPLICLSGGRRRAAATEALAIGVDGLEPERVAPVLHVEVVLIDPFGPAGRWRRQNFHRHHRLPVGVE